MATVTKLPTNLMEAIRYFADPDVCVEFVAKLRWTDGPICPVCDGTEHYYLAKRRVWKCKNRACAKQFSVKVGTILEDSAIPLDKWLCSIWLIANSKNGISSHELHRAVGITQKSAWFVLQRIRLAMQTGSFDKFNGEVEVDETFVGGAARFMHKSERAARFGEPRRGGNPGANKTIVVGCLERGGKVRAEVVPNRSVEVLHGHVRKYAEPGSAIYTDALGAYRGLRDEYNHSFVDHAVRYAEGRVHTNGLENFWCLLKRGIKGTYVNVAPEHLFRYLDERVFTFNMRDLTDLGRFSAVLGRFSAVLGAVSGNRLTYIELTAQA